MTGTTPSVAPEFVWPIRVYWEDTDAGGIVFYANYLKFFERARTEWLRSLGIGQQALRDRTGGIFVVSHTDVHYHRSARLDDQLLVTVSLVEQGRASLTIRQQVLLHHAPHHTVLCDGTIRIGWVDANTLKPTRFPPALLDFVGQSAATRQTQALTPTL
ncbi:tol-pal system-associated acyl-CoA thioesterase [Rhodoferax sp.]|uniref:tol-pal system-associated acyl-CoA thioesterase n=1 Tax=Rhodoferax sp. TaxID=50421 RepID=UPI002750103B|nr:tol-pal system-associated acyl-CoA thioesterase [Rhodoferax sp.]